MAFKRPCLKCLLVGDMDAGKTELMISYTHDTFPRGDLPVFVVVPPVNLIVDGYPITLSLDDASSQEDDFQSRRLSYATADVAIICYNVASKRSFENVLKKWALELRLECSVVPLVLAATNIELRDFPIPKSDDDDYYDTVPDAAFITTEEGEEMAKAIGARYFVECSATTQYNVFYLFYEAARLAKLHSVQTPRQQQTSITKSSVSAGFSSINCCFSFGRGGDRLHPRLCQRQSRLDVI